MKIAIGCDHGGICLKDACIKAARDFGAEIVDFGTFGTDSVDYPDYALKVSLAVKRGEADKGILLCGTGIGISIAANKVKGIRCAHVTNVFCAKATAEHNDANIIALGGRITTPDEAYEIVKVFLNSRFEGGRHELRLKKITDIENENY